MNYNYDVEQDMPKLRKFINYLKEIKNIPGAVMPALQMAQQEYGFIPDAIVDIITELTNLLGIKNGETSEDGKYSMEGIRCIGACGLAPVVKINGDIYGHITPKDIDKILKKYR